MKAFLPGVLLASCGFCQSSVFVNNAATGARQIAPGSLIAITWTASSNLPSFLKMPQVTIESQGQLFEANVLSSQPGGLIRAVIPDNVPVGPADLTLSLNPTTSQSVPLTIQPPRRGSSPCQVPPSVLRPHRR